MALTNDMQQLKDLDVKRMLDLRDRILSDFPSKNPSDLSDLVHFMDGLINVKYKKMAALARLSSVLGTGLIIANFNGRWFGWVDGMSWTLSPDSTDKQDMFMAARAAIPITYHDRHVTWHHGGKLGLTRYASLIGERPIP